jgi:hypothetical protein
MNIVINHFMAAFSTSFDQEKELSYLERDDFNRLFSNSRAIRVASAKQVQALENFLLDKLTTYRNAFLVPSVLYLKGDRELNTEESITRRLRAL